MVRKSVLFLYNFLFHYRIPIWNILAEKYDLKAFYSRGKFCMEFATGGLGLSSTLWAERRVAA
jgi:hypothetical protein